MLLVLPYEIVIEIAGLVATTSPHSMEDLCSLRGTYVSAVHPRMSRITYKFNLSTYTVCLCSCQTMRTTCLERVVRSHVALEREESMRW